MNTLYAPRTKGAVESDFCARKENFLGWGDAVSHPTGVLKINTLPQGGAQTYKTQAVATPTPQNVLPFLAIYSRQETDSSEGRGENFCLNPLRFLPPKADYI